MKRDLISVVEACYSLEGDLGSWVSRVADSLNPLLDHGHGVSGWVWKPGAWRTGEFPCGVSETMGRFMWEAADRFTTDELVSLFFGPRIRSATERLGTDNGLDEHPRVGPSLAAPGVKDFDTISVWDSAGTGLVFTGPSPEVLRTPPRQAARLERLAAHVLAGLRLRQTLEQIDAVILPDGAMVHAENDAKNADSREALRRAVTTLEHARTPRGRRDPEEALAAWQALVEGRWSLVERFESDGRRYLLARQNAPGTESNALLPGLQAHALLLRAISTPFKLIAYELGLSIASVHGLVSDGMRRLGVSSELELVSLFRSRALAELERMRAETKS
jgi:DNA-binding CsgD family transcriptional regulator